MRIAKRSIDQIIKNSSHRSIKKIELFMGERYTLQTHCLGIENLGYLFRNCCLITVEGDETPFGYYSSPYNLINVLVPFQSLFTMKFS